MVGIIILLIAIGLFMIGASYYIVQYLFHGDLIEKLKSDLGKANIKIAFYKKITENRCQNCNQCDVCNEHSVRLNGIKTNAEELMVKKKNDTFLYIVPDPENQFEKVFEIESTASYFKQKKWMDIIANAVAEYYKNSEYYDVLDQELGPVDLVLDAIKKHNIPLVRYWEAEKVEKLSARWLKEQV